MTMNEVILGIKNTDKSLEKNARHKMDFKTKPQGSLGVMESIAVKMALVRQGLSPEIGNKQFFVFAGDHGITAEGVSAFPAEVTPQMVLNFINGGAAINVLCRQNGIGIRVVDMGVNFDFAPNTELIDKKVRKGTRNFLKEDAMLPDEAEQAVWNGMDVVLNACKDSKIDIIGLGEMGIGNSTSASAIISAATGLSPEKTTGRGTGLDDEKLRQKAALITEALKQRKPSNKDGMDILCKVGGFEIAGIAGAVLGAAYLQIPMVLDGFISTAGGLIAFLINPKVKDYFFAGHKSVEIGHQAALEYIGIAPILDLNMHLGEGTGAALAIHIIDASCRIMCEMASFEEAGVSNKD